MPLPLRDQEAKMPFRLNGLPRITTIKMLSGEELVAMVMAKGKRRWTLAVPMKIIYDESGSVHLVPWITPVVEIDRNGGFVWSRQPFYVRTSHITVAANPMPVVRNEYVKRLKDPKTWLQSSDIDSFSIPEGMKLQ